MTFDASSDKPSGQGAWVAAYVQKFAGAGAAAAPQPPREESFYSFIGSFFGIALLGLLDGHYSKLVTLVPAFGAMAVLLFSAWKAPFAQPRNAILGNTIGGILGVAVRESMLALKLDGFQAAQNALAVSLTVVCQERTSSVHPPGGATALIYTSVPAVQHLSVYYIFTPACLSAVLLVLVALFTNNISGVRSFPQTWGLPDLVIQQFKGSGSSAQELELQSPLEERVEPSRVAVFFAKFQGAGGNAMPLPTWTQTGFSFLGSFTGIFILSIMDAHLFVQFPDELHLKVTVAPFGALAVLIFSAWKAPLAQPRNAFGGNLIGATVGVVMWKLFELLGGSPSSSLLFLPCSLAVAATIVLQELTGTVHPPGGAAALAFVAMPGLQVMGFQYIACPILLGTFIMVCTAMVTNNLSADRTYPQTWGGLCGSRGAAKTVDSTPPQNSGLGEEASLIGGANGIAGSGICEFTKMSMTIAPTSSQAQHLP